METTDGSSMSSTSKKAGPIKGVRVHLFGDRKKSPVGVAARSLGDLIKKACVKFQIPSRGVKVCLPDGMQVDSNDYFDTLENQTTLVLVKEGDSLTQAAVVRFVERLLAADPRQRLRRELSEVLRRQDGQLSLAPAPAHRAGPDRTQFSRRADDPDWFKDLDTGAATKEEFMRRRCEARIRTYFYKSRDQVRSAPAALLPTLDGLLEKMQSQLREERFHGHYFDRSSDREDKEGQGRLCDKKGQFSCQGAFEKDSCDYDDHLLNPYRSREDRIVFSTWNLDHRIERSRTILPCLVRAAEEAGRRQVNWSYFYKLLFTTKNLRLVHIVCHDKASHDRFTCDQKKVFVRASPPR